MKWLLLLLTVFVPALLAAELPLAKWEWMSGSCPAGLHPQPNGPFAIELYCEDALGTYLSVVYLKPIGMPLTQNGRWSLDDRHWHEGTWGSDITGFQWSKDGTKLLVSTSPIYGSGGFFELDLNARKAKQQLPKGAAVSKSNPGPGYTISGAVLPLLAVTPIQPSLVPRAADISLAGINIHDPASTIRVLGKDVHWESEVMSYARFMNANRTEQITVFVHNGDYEYSVSEFSVQKPEPGSDARSLAGIRTFSSGKGIRLGLTEAALITLLGQPHSISTSNSQRILKYEVTDAATSAFLKHYNMPIYYGTYTFTNGLLVRFDFGFAYP